MMLAARRSLRRGLRAGMSWALLAALAVPFLLPFLWMLSTAFKPAALVYTSPPSWIPHPPTLRNLREAWALLDFTTFACNSLRVSAFTVLGTLLSSSLVGYAFAVLSARGRSWLFAALLATLMVPAPVTLVPVFILFSKLGWVNTHLPLVVPHFFADPFFVFLFRQFFRGLPPQLYESAELDGCNPLQTYWHVALPLARPALGTAAVFAFAGAWNDLLGPLVYVSTNDRYTLSLGLALFQGLHYAQLHYLMPMCLVALAPVVAVFLVAQRYLAPGQLGWMLRD